MKRKCAGLSNFRGFDPSPRQDRVSGTMGLVDWFGDDFQELATS
jgi:hypothetical protein